jgi:hypothetical protein
MPETHDFDQCRTCGAWRSAHNAGLQDPLTAHDFAEPKQVPDFDEIAKQVLREQGIHEDYAGQLHIANALKEVWNARGAADLTLLTEHFNEAPADLVASAIRSLDR